MTSSNQSASQELTQQFQEFRDTATSQLALQGIVSKLTEQLAAQSQIIAQHAAQIRCLQRGSKKTETYYQKLLEKKLNAQRKDIPGVGITDLTTDDAHIEIKLWHKYHQVPGQLAAYQQGSFRNKSIVYFFGMPPTLSRLNQIQTLMTAHGIQMFSIDDDDLITEHKHKQEVERDTSDSLHRQALHEWLFNNIVQSSSKHIHVHRFEKAYRKWQTARKASKHIQVAG